MSHFEWENIDINAGNMVYGIISNIDYDNLTADVEGVGTNIPIHYHCEEDAIEDSGRSYDMDYPDEQDELGATAFIEDDEVLVMFRRVNNEDPVIIGFPDEAKACWVEGLFSIVYEHGGVNKYLIYDPISKSIKMEDEDGQPDDYYSAPAYELAENDQAYYSDNNLIIVSFYDWNDSVWIYRNSLKWGEETHQDHVFQTQFQIFSIPGEAEDIKFSPDGAVIILDRSLSIPSGFYVARMEEGDSVSNDWRRRYISYSGGKYAFNNNYPYTRYFDGQTADENWVAVKWDTRNFSYGDLTEGGGTGGAHLPVRTWAQYAYGGDYSVLLYDYDYNAGTGKYHYGPYFDPPDTDLTKGFATTNVLWGTYPGTDPSVEDPYMVPLGSQVWYGCCKTVSGIIDCTDDSDCNYPGGPLQCFGSYCPSYTCYWPYEENQSWGYDWESRLTVYGVDSNVGEYKSCSATWGATMYEVMRLTSSPWLCPSEREMAYPLHDDYLNSGTCNYTYTHSKSVFFDANLPIYLVIENSNGNGTHVWNDSAEIWEWTVGQSIANYYASLEGVRNATLYIKDGNGNILSYSCEANIEDYSGVGHGYGIVGGKIFVAWGSSGETLTDERNDYVLIFYDIIGEKKFVSNGDDVTTKILNMISGLEFMEGGYADIDNVKFVSTRFSPKIALLHGY